MILLVSFIVLFFCAAGECGPLLEVTTQEMTINRTPGGVSTDDRLTRGALVEQTGPEKDGWYPVRLRNGEEGWVPLWMAAPAGPGAVLAPAFATDTAAFPMYGVVVADNVGWRSTPYGGLPAKVDTTRGGLLPRGAVVKIIGKIYHWFQVQLAPMEKVWVYDEALSPAGEPPEKDDFGIPVAKVEAANAVESDFGPSLEIRFTSPVPYKLESGTEPGIVAFRFYGVDCESVGSAPQMLLKKNAGGWISCYPGSDVIEGLLLPAGGKPAGFIGGYDGSVFRFIVRDPARAPIKKIVLDPGHGAVDPAPKGFADGTHSKSGLKEKDVVVAISQKAAEHLRAGGYEVFLTREGNTAAMMDIYNRVVFSEAVGGDLFLSIHANGDENPRMKGVEVYWYEQQSRPLAEMVARGISEATGRETGLTLYGSFGVIRQTRTPAVLVETGYMTNPEEGAMFGDERFIERCADGIARGVTTYIESINGAAR